MGIRAKQALRALWALLMDLRGPHKAGTQCLLALWARIARRRPRLLDPIGGHDHPISQCIYPVSYRPVVVDLSRAIALGERGRSWAVSLGTE